MYRVLLQALVPRELIDALGRPTEKTHTLDTLGVAAQDALCYILVDEHFVALKIDCMAEVTELVFRVQLLGTKVLADTADDPVLL